MRKVLLAGVLLVAMAMAAPAWASSVIPWTGNGSDNLPCEEGAHWVLAPAFEIDSATLVVDGQSYPMTQHGNGSWSADSVGAIPEDVDFESFAWVEYTGEGDERNHLQLSHCTEDEPTPTPTDPTETPSPPPGRCEGHGQDRDRCKTKTAPPPVAFTGPPSGLVVGLALTAALFLLVGLFLLRRGVRSTK